jgi:hypothetical protein
MQGITPYDNQGTTFKKQNHIEVLQQDRSGQYKILSPALPQERSNVFKSKS